MKANKDSYKFTMFFNKGDRYVKINSERVHGKGETDIRRQN